MYKIIKTSKDTVEFVETLILERFHADVICSTVETNDYDIVVCGHEYHGNYLVDSASVRDNNGKTIVSGKSLWDISSWLYNHRKSLNDLIRSLNSEEEKAQEDELTKEQQEAVKAVEESEQNEFVFDDDEEVPAMTEEESSIIPTVSAGDIIAKPHIENPFVPPLFLEIKKAVKEDPDCFLDGPLFIQYYYMSFYVYEREGGSYLISAYDPINDEVSYYNQFSFTENNFSGLVDCVCYAQSLYYKYYYGIKARKKFWRDFRESKILSGAPNPNKSHMKRKEVVG